MVLDLRHRPNDFDDLDPEELAMLEPGPFVGVLPICAYCGVEIPLDEVETDHIIPRSRGGADLKANRIICCAICNREKGARTLEEMVGRVLQARTQ